VAQLEAYGLPLNGPKIGDLVLCPKTESTDWRERSDEYVGLVIGIAGYKLTILGGAETGAVSWDGIPGREAWDMFDVRLIKRAA
jgi:hypothetical protein